MAPSANQISRNIVLGPANHRANWNPISVNTSLASEQQRLEVLSVKSNWQKEVAQECEKLSDWRCQNRPIGNENGKMTKPDLGNRNSDFGPQVTQESFHKDTRHGTRARPDCPGDFFLFCVG